MPATTRCIEGRTLLRAFDPVLCDFGHRANRRRRGDYCGSVRSRLQAVAATRYRATAHSGANLDTGKCLDKSWAGVTHGKRNRIPICPDTSLTSHAEEEIVAAHNPYCVAVAEKPSARSRGKASGWIVTGEIARQAATKAITGASPYPT